jgi:hypothetical protein
MCDPIAQCNDSRTNIRCRLTRDDVVTGLLELVDGLRATGKNNSVWQSSAIAVKGASREAQNRRPSLAYVPILGRDYEPVSFCALPKAANNRVLVPGYPGVSDLF